MPKLKTHKGTAKRIKMSAGGKLTRQSAFTGHNLHKKGGGRKRSSAVPKLVTGKMAKNIKRALGV